MGWGDFMSSTLARDLHIFNKTECFNLLLLIYNENKPFFIRRTRIKSEGIILRKQAYHKYERDHLRSEKGPLKLN